MNIKLIIALVVFITVMLGFGALILDEAANGKSTTTVLPVIATKLVKIDGMTCESCEQALAGAAKKMKSVESIVASAKDGNAVVKYDLVKTDIDTVMKEIRKTGYRPVSYEEYDEKSAKKESAKVENNTTMKCGAGKCGSSGH